MDSLRFGPITAQAATVPLGSSELHKNHSVMEGVISGVAAYGNCFGVPNLGGETKFEACYAGNPLVNAFALGLVRRDQIFYAKAAGEGNPVIYVGSKTGRDGIHGAHGDEEFRKLRVSAGAGRSLHGKTARSMPGSHANRCDRRHRTGAAGLTCSTCERARGSVLKSNWIVPKRETGMST
jgi:phosphoribosylformylglycinamidine synthase